MNFEVILDEPYVKNRTDIIERLLEKLSQDNENIEVLANSAFVL